MSENAIDGILKHSNGLAVYRRLIFAASQLPIDLPGYWEEVAKFASFQSADEVAVTPSQARTFVDNLHFLNEAAFASDTDLHDELVGKCPTAVSVGVILISPNSTCCLCGSKLTVRKDRPSTVVMYTESVGTIVAKHYRKVCSRARSGCFFVQHYGFYTTGSDCIQFNSEWKRLPYFVSSRETGFEMRMLEKFDAELLLGQVSYSQRADIYNYHLGYEHTGEKAVPLELRHVTKSTYAEMLHNRLKLDRRRLEAAHLLYAFLTVQHWYPDVFSKAQYKAGGLDNTLLDITPLYHSTFSNVYADHKCRTPGCSNTLVIDGNMKNHRDVCKADYAGYVQFDGLPGRVRTGCMNTPDLKSRYCKLHKPRACTLTSEHGEDVHQEGVVETILQKKVLRNRTLYKVLLLGRSEADTAWVQADQIPSAVLHEYESSATVETSLQERSVSGQTTVTALSVAKGDTTPPPAKQPRASRWISVDTTGPLNIESEEKLTCQTVKDKKFRLNDRSAGIFSCMRPCGMIVTVSELFISESLSQVYGILHDFLQRSHEATSHLEHICYDDGCHLRKYARNSCRKDLTDVTKKLASLEIVVDKFHMAGHVDPWCLKHCDAHKIPALDKVDTEICEQTFSWLSRYAKITRSMTQAHFLFFLLYLCDLHNRRLLHKLKFNELL